MALDLKIASSVLLHLNPDYKALGGMNVIRWNQRARIN